MRNGFNGSDDPYGFGRDPRLIVRPLCTAVGGGCLVLCVLLGCGASPAELDRDLVARPTAAVQDVQLSHLDGAAPRTDFDETGGTIVLGPQWAPYDAEDGAGAAWVIGKVAEFSFPVHSTGSDYELSMDCRPFTWEGAEPQNVAVSVNGIEVASAGLRRGWDTTSVKIPSRALKPGINHVEFIFDYAVRPADVTDQQDGRELAACFRWIAVKPMALESIETAPAELGASRTLTLRGGGGVEVPLPPRTRLVWNLETVDAAPEGIGGVVRHVSPGGDDVVVWRGLLGKGTVHSIEVVNRENGCGSVSLELRPGAHGGGEATLSWSEEHFELSGERPSIGQPHVFVYLVDTVRADSLRLYGSGRPTSPRLAEFAADGVVYDRAIAASSWTLPSVVSLLTGVYAGRHGVMQGDVKLNPESEFQPLATLLGRRGYTTLGLSQSFVAGPNFGIDTGFEKFRLANRLNEFSLRTAETRRSLVSWLEHDYDWDRPMFVYVHTVGPHAPYNPPERFRSYARENPGELGRLDYLPAQFKARGHEKNPEEIAHLRALYDGEVQYADEQFGHFVDVLKYFGLYDNSVIVFLSDHGEEFFDHGGFDHGRTLYDEVARIPLVIKYPGGEGSRGTRVDQLVSEVDIVPTILELTSSAESPVPLDGRPLPRASLGPNPGTRPVLSELNPVANEIYESVDYRAVWIEWLKCIENLGGNDRFGRPEPGLQAFDLARDPGERESLPSNDPRVEECRNHFAAWQAQIDDGTSGALEHLVDDEAHEMLKELGYIK